MVVAIYKKRPEKLKTISRLDWQEEVMGQMEKPRKNVHEGDLFDSLLRSHLKWLENIRILWPRDIRLMVAPVSFKRNIFKHFGKYYVLATAEKSVNQLCVRIAKCELASISGRKNESIRARKNAMIAYTKRYHIRNKAPNEVNRYSNKSFQIAFSHEVCDLAQDIVSAQLQCAFLSASRPKEIMTLRHPLLRALSVYYFWGELWMAQQANESKEVAPTTVIFTKYGSRKSVGAKGVAGVGGDRNFVYHGVEDTPPPLDIALAFSRRLPYREGMPGPSFTWSLFADNVQDSIAALQSGRISPIVMERLDESLVVAAAHLGWSLADMVVVMPRKALSTHPPLSAWPQEALHALNNSLHRNGEVALYRAAIHELDRRVQFLREAGIAVDRQIVLLRELRRRVTQYCLSPKALAIYKAHLSQRLYPHPKPNKLRDVESIYVEQGHSFRAGPLEREMVYSFDVCGGCEANAILHAMNMDSNLRVDTAPLLDGLDSNHHKHVKFANCPGGNTLVP